MLIPQALPDELCGGHVGRIQLLNGLGSFAETVAGLRKKALQGRVGSDEGMSIVGAIATVCGTGVDEYVWLHSFLPFSAFAIGERQFNADGYWNLNTQIKVGMTTPRSGAYLCEECVAEDMKFRRYSYWRRAHQIPGAIWCLKHGGLLLRSDFPRAFEQTPKDCLSHARLPAAKFEPQLNLASSAVQRYLEACTLLMENRVPIRRDEVKRRLVARARLMHVRVGDKGVRPPLSDIALDEFPSEWLGKVFQTFAKKKRGVVFLPIDGVARTAGTCPTSESIALAIAILFDKPEIGFSCLLGETPGSEKVRQYPPTRTRTPGSAVGRMFVERGGNLESLAAALNVPLEDVFNSMPTNRNGLIYALRSSAEVKALREFLKGAPLAEVCANSGVSVSSVEGLIRLYAGRIKLPDPEETVS